MCRHHKGSHLLVSNSSSQLCSFHRHCRTRISLGGMDCTLQPRMPKFEQAGMMCSGWLVFHCTCQASIALRCSLRGNTNQRGKQSQCHHCCTRRTQQRKISHLASSCQHVNLAKAKNENKHIGATVLSGGNRSKRGDVDLLGAKRFFWAIAQHGAITIFLRAQSRAQLTRNSAFSILVGTQCTLYA